MPAARKPAAPKAPKPGQASGGGKDPIVSRPLELDFPARLVGLPVIYELVKRYDLVPNIKRANVTQSFGYIQLELKGRASAMEAAMRYLEKSGVGVAPIEKDVVES